MPGRERNINWVLGVICALCVGVLLHQYGRNFVQDYLDRAIDSRLLNKDKWPSGSYCILANGDCPPGFTRHDGYMKAISLYAASASYIRSGRFGDSKIQCHGNCGQYGHWTGELYIHACCK